VQAQTTPWGITMVGAPTFWSTYGTSGAGAKVEIIDTGHQQGHVDLPAVSSANCAGVYGGCDDASTAGWHGTHVLGIVTARNNTDGVVGVAPGIAASDVYVYGACDNSGVCPTDQVTAGINTGVWNVDVINLSLTQPYDAAQATAVAQAWSNGIVIVAAAGNNLSNATVYPAAYPNVLGVSGVLSNKAFAGSGTTSCGYSNYGSHVDLAAPFEAYSTIGINTYGTLCGTSMAAPHVTGVAALVAAANPAWTNQQIVSHLTSTAEDRGAIGWDPYYGYGIVRAVTTTTTPPPVPTITGPTSITSASTYTWGVTATGGNGTYAYQWQYRTQGTTTWTNVGTGTSYARVVAAGNPSFELQVIATSAGLTGTDTHLVSVSIPVSPTPLGVTISGPSTVNGGTSNTWTANPTGGNGTYTYQWQYSTNGSTWSNGATTKTYTRPVNLLATNLYLRVTVTSNGASVTSSTFNVTVIQDDSGGGCVFNPNTGQTICT
jgi:subtilisin family serine protease